MSTPDWQRGVPCSNPAYPRSWWFPEQGDTGLDAKRVCVTCPVRLTCLAGRLDRGEDGGIWGGHGGDIGRHMRRLWITTSEQGWGPGMGSFRAVMRFAAIVTVEADRLRVEASTGRAPAEDRPNRNGPNATHGRMSTYNRGCGCRACYLAMVIYTTDLRYREDEAA